MKTTRLLSAVGVITVLAGSATAATITELNTTFTNVKSTVTAGAFPRNPAPGAFASINGTVALTAKALTQITLIRDGNLQSPTATVSGISASINIASGDVSGGTFSVLMSDGTFEFAQAMPRALAGTDIKWSGGDLGSYRIDGDIFNFIFGGPIFAGVNVAPFFANQPLIGSFFNFAFRPNTVAGTPKSFDEDTTLGFVVATMTGGIPLPSPLGMASVGLMGLGLIRRRRSVA